jgi:hypothetical protein
MIEDSSWYWNVDLTGLIGKFVHAEINSVGVVREGKITNVIYKTVKINDEEFLLPDKFELNGDSLDRIDFIACSYIKAW